MLFTGGVIFFLERAKLAGFEPLDSSDNPEVALGDRSSVGSDLDFLLGSGECMTLLSLMDGFLRLGIDLRFGLEVLLFKILRAAAGFAGGASAVIRLWGLTMTGGVSATTLLVLLLLWVLL